MAKDLDFSKFKKIFSDEHKTHLQHPKGHTIIVAHVALTPKTKEQLDKLPMHNPKEMMEHALENAEHMMKHLAKGGEAKEDLPAVSRINMHYKDVTKRVPELTEAAKKVAAGELHPMEYDKLVNKHKPVAPYDFVPQPATAEEAMRALNEAKRKRYGLTHEIPHGEQTDLRLDIPAYKEHGVWVNSIHRKDAPTVYGSHSAVKNATMIGAPEKAMKVASGEATKSPFAVIRGEWNPLEERAAVLKAQKYLKHKDWRQVGYDPERHGYFYDRETMHPIEGAEEVIQIGPLVLAKNPKYGKKEEQKFAEGGEAKPFHGYNPEKHARTGGLNDSYREKYNREHGSHLKRPVTGHPAAGTEAAGRKKSFCARMKGVKGPTSEGGELTPKGAALKRWNCHAHGGAIHDDHDEECEHYAKGGKLEKKRVFGPSGEPNPDTKKTREFYERQKAALEKLAQKRYGVPLAESKGKFQYDLRDINKMRKKQGKPPLTMDQVYASPDYEVANPWVTHKDKESIRLKEQKSNPKPDWRSGELEAQRHIGAKAHEMGHLELMPLGVPLGDMQTLMDEGSELASREYGGSAKQTELEVQPMAMEEALRKRAGITQFNRPQYTDPRRGMSSEELSEESPERTTLDTGRSFAKRKTNEEGKLYDLIGMSRNLSPENRQRLKDIDEGILKFTPEGGWRYSTEPDALLNLRAQGRIEEATKLANNRYRGEPIDLPHYADGGDIEEVPGKHLVHYSQHEEPLEMIDPTRHGSGRAGHELRRGKLIPRTYYYEAGSEPESVVSDSARHRYVVDRPQGIMDLASEEAGPYLQKVRDMNELEELLKASGFAGYKNSAHPQLAHAVAVFHPQKPVHHKHLKKYAEGGEVPMQHYAKGGLYANIHAKQERIAHGSGEHMRKPGKKGAPTAEAFKEAAKTAHMNSGGFVQHYAEGDGVEELLPHYDDIARSPASAKTIEATDEDADKIRTAMGEMSKYDTIAPEESPTGPRTHYAKPLPGMPGAPAPKAEQEEEEQAPSRDLGNMAVPAGTKWTSYGENEIPQAKPAPATPTPQEQHKRETAKFYNMLAATKYSSSGPEGAYDPSVMDYMYGPNGESPKEFDSELYERAEKQASDKQMEEYNDRQQQELARARENVVRMRAGQPLLPSPTATATPEAQGNLPPPVATGRGNLGDKVVPKDTFGYNQYVENIKKGAGYGVTSILQGTEAAKQRARLEEQAYNTGARKMENLYSHFEKSLTDTNDDYRKALDKLMTTDIKNDYLHNKGVGAKIGVAIGMALAGFGGQGQAAMDYIKSQIANDLEVQKQNMGRTQTALGLIRDHYQSLSTAIPMYQALALGQTSERIKQIAAQMGTPEAAANANALINKLYMDIAPKLKEAAGYKMLQDLASPENEGGAANEADVISKMQVHPDPNIRAIGDALGPKVVSGYKRPPNTPTETTLSVIRNSDTFEELARDMAEFARSLGPIGKLTPKERSIAQAKVIELKNALTATYPPGSGGTAEEREAIEKAIQNPVSFLYGIKGGEKALEAILNSVRMRKATFERVGNLVPRESARQPQQNVGTSFKPTGR
jgi:hypothetical protein